ncbi:MotE family protein [Roseicyclus amphidinii]|uniref:MotE family protein n=1 Tax=Roseicyclus amphidinii TaxID=3034232 RepID=UPI0024E050A2|nr:hypothetical protein [Roseicyclus sp. Amp-Y-6]
MARAPRSAPRRATRPRGRWRQKWALTALGFVFALSALLRLGTLEGALAEAVASDSSVGSHAASPGPSGHAGDAAASMTGALSSDMTADMARTLQDALAEIDALRSALDRREAAVADRERAVAAAQALVEARLAELEAAETRLEALIARSDTAAESDLDRLTRVYETMPPEEAAAVFAQMQPGFAAGFLARMSPAASATLMAELPPEQAYAVSVIIATRNSAAPRLDPPRSAGAETEN